ncbi:MAG: acyl-CoA dehydrogenase, partial [Betaproteobacteria bacterium]|nr:acyl-CoA dehydrogenase [Betaproteobacteria bacterium]
FGHVVMGWIWLDIGVATSPASTPLTSGLLSALRYFHAYELPKVDAWLKVVRERESVCRDMPHDWF